MRLRSFGFMIVSSLAAAPLPAQEPAVTRDSARADSVQRDVERYLVWANARPIRWYHLVGVIGAVTLTSALDEPLQRYAQRHRSNTSNDVSAVFRLAGEPAFYGAVSLGTLGIGFLFDDADVKRAGRRMVASMIVAGVVMGAGKRMIGRSRPNEGTGAFVFHPFTSLQDSAGIQTRGSMPSGHAAAAFALASTVAADVDNGLVDVAVYAFAAGTAFSRIYDNRHWLSDVSMGAAIGITTAKVVSGQWRIFNLKPPDFLLTPTGAPAVGWRIPLGHISTAP